MKVFVIAVGKPRHSALAAAIGEYEERAARHWPLERIEVREEPAVARRTQTRFKTGRIGLNRA